MYVWNIYIRYTGIRSRVIINIGSMRKGIMGEKNEPNRTDIYVSGYMATVNRYDRSRHHQHLLQPNDISTCMYAYM